MPVRCLPCLLLVLLLGCGEASQPPPSPAPLSAAVGRMLQQGQAAFVQGRYAEALRLAEAATAEAPDHPDPHFLRARVLAAVQRFDAAEEAYQTVLAHAPAYPSAWFFLGNTHTLRGRHRDALAAYERELAVVAEPPAAVLRQAGRAYLHLGRPDSARLYYDAALRAAPDDALGHAWMSMLDETEGTLDAALQHARQAHSLAPNDPDHRYRLGMLLYRTGTPSAALAHLRAAALARPWHEGSHYNLGRVLLALGDTTEGQRLLAYTDTLQSRNADIALAKLGAYQHPDDPARWQHYAALLQQAGRQAEYQQARAVLRFLATH